MEELKLAVKYLNKRAVNTAPLNKRRMKEYGKVVPLSEVNAVLEMVQNSEFKDFHKYMANTAIPTLNKNLQL